MGLEQISGDEGFEKTRTLHRLGLFRELGISLKTTNSIESLHLPHGALHRQGGLLEELEPAATVGGHRIAGHRTGAMKDPGESPSADVASRAPDGAELGLELRRDTGVVHHGRFVNFN